MPVQGRFAGISAPAPSIGSVTTTTRFAFTDFIKNSWLWKAFLGLIGWSTAMLSYLGGVRAGLEIDSVLFVSIVIVNLGLEAFALARQAVPQCAQSGGRRRADAAHQCQRAPEGETLFPLP